MLGIPFDFMPTGSSGPVSPPNPPYTVSSLPDRSDLRIEFPRLAGYAWQPGATRLRLDPTTVRPYQVSVLDRPTLVELRRCHGRNRVSGYRRRAFPAGCLETGRHMRPPGDHTR